MQSVAQFGFNTIISRKKSFHASIISLLESVYELDITISLQSSLTLSRVKLFRSKGQVNGFPALSNLFVRIRPGYTYTISTSIRKLSVNQRRTWNAFDFPVAMLGSHE